MEHGDRVMYSKKFCRYIGAYTGEIPFMKGRVVGPVKPGQRIIQIRWDGEKHTQGVYVTNLVRVKDIHKEPV